MARITRKSVDTVFNLAEIEDVVSDYVNIKKRGSNYMGLCPFHNEKTPSFVVSPAKNIYKCFGCGEGGNPINFVMDYNGISFVEAIELLAQKYGVELEYEQLSQDEKQEQLSRDSLTIIMEAASSYYQHQLRSTEEGKSVGLQYFKRRGFNKAILDEFQIGYASSDSEGLHNYLKKEGHAIDKLSELGLENKYGKDFFRERLIFPIFSDSGKTVAFAGRVIASTAQGPKYINSPETELYEKRRVLYGFYQAKTTIRKLRNCFIVEGYTDVMSLHQMGINNAVATSGTSLTQEHAHLLKRHTDKVTFIFDSDKAGIKAADRGSKIIFEQNLNLDIVLLPEGEDPDSFAQSSGKVKFDEYVEENAKDYVIFKLELIADINKARPAESTRLIKDAMATIAVIPDQIKKQLYLREASRILKIDETFLKDELREAEYLISKEEIKAQRRKESRASIDVAGKTSPSQVKKSKTPHYYQERDLLRAILQHGHHIIQDETGEELSGIEYAYKKIKNFIRFNYEPFNRIITEIFSNMQDGVILESTHFVNHKEREIQKLCIDILTDKEEMSLNWVERWDYPLQTQLAPEENHQEDIWSATIRFVLVKIPELSSEIKEKVSALSSDYEKNSKEINSLLEVQNQLVSIKKQYAEKYNTIVYDK